MDKNTVLTVDVPGLLGNDSDPDGDTITPVIVGAPTHGVLNLNSDGSLTCSPDIGFIGTEVFTYRAQDNVGALSNLATVRITVTGSNNQVVVNLITDPWDSTKTALRIIGTDAADNIQLLRIGNTGAKFRVTVNGVAYGDFEPTGHVMVYGLGGNDLFDMTSSITTPMIIIGGDGDDVMTAGDGAAILLGGAGKDTLNASKGRSILIGGDGEDKIVGGQDDDIVIGDITQDQINLSRLVSILETWNRLDKTYTQRIALLGGPTGISGLTLQGDNASDSVNGNNGSDWFFIGSSDRITGKSGSEVTTEV
jgi:Ca2+-binding RTX toxin-like protein